VQAEASIDWRIRVTETAHKAGFQPDAASGALICTPAVIENFAREIERHPSAEIAALRERIAGMEKDAARYRYLRLCGAIVDFTHCGPWKFTDDVDKVIDALLANRGTPKEPK
jgi:hypothetical protein